MKMQTYYELNTVVQGNPQRTIDLPEDIPVGKVTITVSYAVPEQATEKRRLLTVFLTELPLNASGLPAKALNNALSL